MFIAQTKYKKYLQLLRILFITHEDSVIDTEFSLNKI